MAVEINIPEAQLVRRTKPGGGPDDPPDTTSGGTTSSGGSSSGGSSDSGSSSSGGSSAPAEPQDPFDRWLGNLGNREQHSVSIFESIYQELWGEPAPQPILEAALKQGMNAWEFEEAQKRNPAWWKTEAAQDAASPFDTMLAQMGLVPKHKPKSKSGDNKHKGGRDGYPPEGVKVSPHIVKSAGGRKSHQNFPGSGMKSGDPGMEAGVL